MALFKPYKITSDKLEDLAIQEGQIVITTDTKKLYVDISATERIEITADAEVDLSDYVTTSTLTSTIGEEASARQKQDQLLEQAIDDKLDADDIIAGSNVQVNHDDESGHITISATDTKYTAGTGLGMISNGFYILNGGVGLNQLANDSVSEDKLVDGAVDTAKIANGAVTADKLAEGVIPEIPDVTLASLGVTATAEELNYVDGVTSNIQTQLNNKAATTHNHAASAITSGTFSLDRIPTITDAKISGISANKITGTIASANLPSYVDDVLEYNGQSNFPEEGESGKIYVDTSTNKTYRWGGSSYVEISASLALGTTSSTAFRGDYGNVAYTHATAKGAAFASGLYKITTNAQGHVTAATAVTKADITGLGIPAQDTNTNTTYTLTKSGSTITLTGSDGSKTSVTDANTTYSLSSFGITATAAELNKLDGCTATVTELNYVDGVTSNIQTQLNNKAAASHNHSAANITSGTLAVARGGTGTTALTGASGLIHNMFDTGGVTSYIASFTSNWADGGYCTPQQLRSAQGLGNTLGALPVANGGTGSTTASAARSALGITPANIGALPLAGGTMNANAVIARTGSSTSWVTGRSVALLKTTTSGSSFYGPLWSCKTYQGSWDCGTYTSNTLHFSYITDTDFSKNNNKQTADIVFNTNGSITAKTFVGALSGNASTATTATQANYWTTARTLTFTGNVTGSVSVRGNANMSCALTLANDSVTSAKIAANAVTASEIASGAVGLSELSSAVGTVAVQSATPTDSHVKLWIKV